MNGVQGIEYLDKVVDKQRIAQESERVGKNMLGLFMELIEPFKYYIVLAVIVFIIFIFAKLLIKVFITIGVVTLIVCFITVPDFMHDEKVAAGQAVKKILKEYKNEIEKTSNNLTYNNLYDDTNYFFDQV